MKNLLSKTKYFLLFTVLLIGSCEEKIDTEPLVITEEIIFVSGEILRVTGRIVAVGQIPVTDHGFQIADNETFSSPSLISLGPKEVPGRFIGAFEELRTNTNYFVRAYMEINGELRFGDTSEFTSLTSEVLGFTSNDHIVGSSITISGRNLNSDVEVFFGSVKATIVEFTFESVLRVRIPTPLEGIYDVPIRVISDGHELVLNEVFTYVTGKWIEVTSLPESDNVKRNTHFSQNGEFYYGVRKAVDATDPDYFLKYNIGSGQWSQTNFTGTSVVRPILFDGGYIGGVKEQLTGTTSFINSQDFWTLDTNGNFQLEGQTPFALFNGKAFKSGDDLYVFGGSQNNFATNRVVYIYNFTAKTWNVFDTAPIDITDEFPSFEHGGNMYFVNLQKELWRYNPQLKEWNMVSNYPGTLGSLPTYAALVDHGLGAVIGDFAYMGLANRNRKVWEYDILNNSWNPKITPPGVDNDDLIGWYTTNDRLYVLRTKKLFGGGVVLLEFEPFTL